MHNDSSKDCAVQKSKNYKTKIGGKVLEVVNILLHFPQKREK